MGAEQRRNRFRDNIKRLMEDRGLTPRQLALECDIPLKWVKRACEGGLDRLYVRNEDRLTKLAAFLGLSHPSDFWRETPFTDLPTAIRDQWKELAGSAVEKFAREELEACRDACRDLVRCRKVYDLISQMPDGDELAEMYLIELANKEERSFRRSVEDEADYQHGRLTKQREQQNLTSLLDRVRRMAGGDAVVERIQRDLAKDHDRWPVPYARGSHTMREYWVKAIDVLGEDEAAERLHQTYAPIPKEVDAVLKLIGMADQDIRNQLSERIAANIKLRDKIVSSVRERGADHVAKSLFHKITGEELTPQPGEADSDERSAQEESKDIVKQMEQEFPEE